MRALDSKSETVGSQIIVQQGNQIIENGEVEWYSGNELYTRPRRVKVKGVWENVFHVTKSIEENQEQQRRTMFRCHIGDNRIVVVIVWTTSNHKG
jgi:hypothetical protein